MPKTLRLFIAVNFTDEIKESLNVVTQEIKKHVVQGNFTHKENFHLTLAFIGETKEYESIKQAMNLAVTKTKAKTFDLLIEGFGKFKLKDGDTYWVGVQQNPMLSDITRALIKELKSYGFYIDDREFKPHLTLGRRIIFKNGYKISDYQESMPTMEIKVDRISLLKSERIEGKLLYTEVYDCKFE